MGYNSMSQTMRVSGVATAIGNDGGVNYVQYHQTKVVEWTRHYVRLNSNGWRTATTKLRMNQASNQFNLGFKVVQQKGNWFVFVSDKTGNETLSFEDGMTINRYNSEAK